MAFDGANPLLPIFVIAIIGLFKIDINHATPEIWIIKTSNEPPNPSKWNKLLIFT